MNDEAMKYYAGNNAMNLAQGAVGVLGGVKQHEVPRTLLSAGSRLETLNERLANNTESLSMICQQIGAMTGLSGGVDPKSAPSPIGAVHRLNDLADEANAKLSTIENYIASIQRALG